MLNVPRRIGSIIQEFMEGVHEILGKRVKKIILYGSYARGDYREDSDIDIMILIDLTDKEMIEYKEKIWDYAYDIEFDNDFDITLSPLVKNIDNFEAWSDVKPFYINIINEGIVLVGEKD